MDWNANAEFKWALTQAVQAQCCDDAIDVHLSQRDAERIGMQIIYSLEKRGFVIAAERK